MQKPKDNNPYDKSLSDRYNSKYRFDHPHQYMAYATWLETIGDVKGLRVLDMACGSGTSSRMLAERGAAVTGVDVSDSMLASAEAEEKVLPAGISYIHADCSVPKEYADKPFDMVAAAFMLHYAHSREMLDGFVKNVALNLKPGGRFVTINMSPDHPIVKPGENVSHSSRWLDEPFKDGSRLEVILWTMKGEQIVTLTDYHWSKETFEKIFKEAGFTDIKWIDVRMHEEGKSIPNWKELEKENMLAIIEATKI